MVTSYSLVSWVLLSHFREEERQREIHRVTLLHTGSLVYSCGMGGAHSTDSSNVPDSPGGEARRSVERTRTLLPGWAVWRGKASGLEKCASWVCPDIHHTAAHDA